MRAHGLLLLLFALLLGLVLLRLGHSGCVPLLLGLLRLLGLLSLGGVGVSVLGGGNLLPRLKLCLGALYGCLALLLGGNLARHSVGVLRLGLLRLLHSGLLVGNHAVYHAGRHVGIVLGLLQDGLPSGRWLGLLVNRLALLVLRNAPKRTRPHLNRLLLLRRALLQFCSSYATFALRQATDRAGKGTSLFLDGRLYEELPVLISGLLFILFRPSTSI